MVGGDVHAVAQVETVGGEALDAGVEVELVAVEAFCFRDQPREQLFAMALGAEGGVGDEIVDVEKVAPGEILEQAKSGHRDGTAFVLEKCEAITGLHLLANAGQEIFGAEMGSQLRHDGETRADLLVGRGFLNGHGVLEEETVSLRVEPRGESRLS